MAIDPNARPTWTNVEDELMAAGARRLRDVMRGYRAGEPNPPSADEVALDARKLLVNSLQQSWLDDAGRVWAGATVADPEVITAGRWVEEQALAWGVPPSEIAVDLAALLQAADDLDAGDIALATSVTGAAGLTVESVWVASGHTGHTGDTGATGGTGA